MTEILPDDLVPAIDQAFVRYRAYADKQKGELNPATFAAEQRACQAAIGHLTALVRLRALLAPKGKAAEPPLDLDALIAEGRKTLQSRREAPENGV